MILKIEKLAGNMASSNIGTNGNFLFHCNWLKVLFNSGQTSIVFLLFGYERKSDANIVSKLVLEKTINNINLNCDIVYSYKKIQL